MKRLFLAFLLIIIGFVVPASSGWSNVYTPTDLYKWTHIDKGYNQNTISDEGDYLLLSSGRYSVVGIQNNTTDQYFRINLKSVMNGYGENVFPTISFCTGNNYSIKYGRNYCPSQYTYGYTIQYGDRIAPGNRFILFLNGSAQPAKNINMTEPKTIDFFIRKNRAVVIVDNVEVYNVSSIGAVSAIMIAQADGNSSPTAQTHIYNIKSTPQYFGNLTTESSPSANLETSNLDALPNFSICINQTCDVTWYLDNKIMFTDLNTNRSEYVPSVATVGIHNVTVYVSNENGECTNSWRWTVLKSSSGKLSINQSAQSRLIQYENLGIDFSVDLINYSNGLPVKADGRWYVDGKLKKSDSEAVIHEYNLLGGELLSGNHTIKFIATDENGYVSKVWNITYLPNSMDFEIISFESYSEKGTLVFKVSNFTPGIIGNGWSPTYGETKQGKRYNWAYNNGTIISSKVASFDGENLVFDINNAPEGTYILYSSEVCS